jgi:hypothetical protein
VRKLPVECEGKYIKFGWEGGRLAQRLGRGLMLIRLGEEEGGADDKGLVGNAG